MLGLLWTIINDMQCLSIISPSDSMDQRNIKEWPTYGSDLQSGCLVEVVTKVQYSRRLPTYSVLQQWHICALFSNTEASGWGAIHSFSHQPSILSSTRLFVVTCYSSSLVWKICTWTLVLTIDPFCPYYKSSNPDIGMSFRKWQPTSSRPACLLQDQTHPQERGQHLQLEFTDPHLRQTYVHSQQCHPVSPLIQALYCQPPQPWNVKSWFNTYDNAR